MTLLSFVEIKVSLTGLSKFKEGVSKIRELLSLRKGISLHLQEIRTDYPRKQKGNHFWEWKQTIELDSKGNHQWSGENGSNGRLKDKSCNFQGERNFISVKLIVSYKFPQLSCISSASPVFLYQFFEEHWHRLQKLFFFSILELVITIDDMSCDTYYAHLPIKT